MSMYDKNHYNIVISLQLIKIKIENKKIKEFHHKASLVVQWLRILLPRQRT